MSILNFILTVCHFDLGNLIGRLRNCVGNFRDRFYFGTNKNKLKTTFRVNETRTIKSKQLLTNRRKLHVVSVEDRKKARKHHGLKGQGKGHLRRQKMHKKCNLQ